MSPSIIIIVFLALLCSFLNGIHDSSNVVSTMIASRAFSAVVALNVVAVAEFLGPLIFGVAVAKTIGNDVVVANTIDTQVIMAALASAILWNLLTWYLGLPSSSSHALVGGLVGSVVMEAGWHAIKFGGIAKILIALFASPVIGFIFGFLIFRLVVVLSRDATPKINNFFKRGQMVSSVALALSHGANDGSKTMGIIALALVTEGYLKAFAVPLWVIIICALAMALGTRLGGTRLIRTVGGKFYKIQPLDGFASQLSSAVVILGASLFGGPVSTTQVVSSSIMGVGSAERANKVRWSVAQEIATAWLFTIPATAIVSAALCWILLRFVP
jgi:inorganic phosphate transporter, PiT family